MKRSTLGGSVPEKTEETLPLPALIGRATLLIEMSSISTPPADVRLPVEALSDALAHVRDASRAFASSSSSSSSSALLLVDVKSASRAAHLAR